MAKKPESTDTPGGRDLAPEPFAEIKLDTLSDVEQELARVYRNMRMGRCSIPKGNGLTQTLFTLARVKRENVGDELLRRLEAIEQRQAKSEEQAKSH